MDMAARRTITLRRVFGGLLILAVAAIGFTTGTRIGTGDHDHSLCERSALLAGSSVPVPVRRILQRACQDCHSENTRWPWYASAPLISWRIHRDVEKGRAFLNLSRWNDYTESEQRALATAVGAAIQSHVMPPASYIWIHQDARLSSLDRQAIQAWVLGKLQSSPATRETQATCKRGGH
jgi:Haem-binding domain